MTAPHTQQLIQGLIDSARRDGPSVAARAHIWEQVALAPPLSLVAAAATHSTPPGALTAGAGAAKAMAGAAGAGATKLLLAGALAGGLLVGSVGAVVTHYARPTPPALHVVAAPVQHGSPPAPIAAPRAQTPAEPAAPFEIDPPRAPSAGRAAEPSDAVLAHRDPSGSSGDLRARDDLLREAALVGQARTDIVQGKPAEALDLLRTIGRGGARTLEPEELLLQTRALRMLGRDAEAAAVEQALRDRYPDSFLAR